MYTNNKSPQCPLCNASGRLFYTLSEHQAPYYLCSGCGIIWLAKDKWPEHLDAHYSNVYYTNAYVGRPDAFPSFTYRLSLIKRLIPEGGTIVEVGASSGEFLYLLKGRGYQVVGVELSSSAVAAGKARYDIDLYKGTLHDAPIEKESVDAVVLYHVLEHIPDPASFLADAFRVLEPGGRIIIEVPDPVSIDAQISPRLMRSVLDFPHHLFSFTPYCLRMFLTHAGFQVVLKESSAPYVLTSLFHSSSPQSKHTVKETSATVDLTVLVERPLKTNLRRALGAIIPGMKLTVVARKPT
jgi:SAM-dependent methyltransferase